MFRNAARTRNTLSALIAVGVAIGGAAGCAPPSSSAASRGQRPDAAMIAAPLTSVHAAASTVPLKQMVTLHGTIIEKCPTAGCWFRLRDRSGVLKVDTKAAGFTVTDVDTGTVVRVTGTVAVDGDMRVLSARSLHVE